MQVLQNVRDLFITCLVARDEDRHHSLGSIGALQHLRTETTILGNRENLTHKPHKRHTSVCRSFILLLTPFSVLV